MDGECRNRSVAPSDAERSEDGWGPTDTGTLLQTPARSTTTPALPPLPKGKEIGGGTSLRCNAADEHPRICEPTTTTVPPALSTTLVAGRGHGSGGNDFRGLGHQLAERVKGAACPLVTCSIPHVSSRNFLGWLKSVDHPSPPNGCKVWRDTLSPAASGWTGRSTSPLSM